LTITLIYIKIGLTERRGNIKHKRFQGGIALFGYSFKKLLSLGLIILVTMSLTLAVDAADKGLISHWKLESDGTNSVEGAGDFILPDAGVAFETVDGHKGISITRGAVIYRHNWDVNIGSNFTIAMYVKSAPFEGYEILFAKGRKDEECHFEVYLESGYLNLFAPSLGDLKSGIHIHDNELHHIAIIFDGQIANFYVDGENMKTIEIQGSVADGVGEAVMLGLLVEQMFGFEGFISDLRVYNKALNENDIKSLAGVETEPEPQPETGLSLVSLVMASATIACSVVLFKRRRVTA
jgi:arabinan endo-1,5-alpha-L-arabinosidase